MFMEVRSTPGRKGHWLSRLALLLPAAMPAFYLFGPPVHAQSGPLVHDYRGADGGCCSGGIHPDNGHDGQWGQRDVIQAEGSLDIDARTPGQAGILVDASGGNGGNGKDSSINHWGGNGGGGRNIDYSVSDSSITSAGRGIDIYSRGGSGGVYANANGPYGGYGLGGDGHLARITVNDTHVAGFGFGIAAQSGGGGGSDSALVNGFGAERDAGHGGSAGQAAVNLRGATSIAVSGPGPDDVSAGVGLISAGGSGGTAQHTGDFGGHSNAGHGGGASAVTFASSAESSVDSRGNGVHGVIARSLGGNASTGNYADTRAGDGGSAGSITVDSGGRITTLGDRAIGIFALSQGGQGGNGGQGSWASGHPGGAGGTPGAITIVNTGAITTGSDGTVGAKGIVASAVGGEGGQGGDGGTFGHGGDGGPGGLAPYAITITNGGSVSTSGNDAAAVVVNSAGGGGGLALPSNGIIAVGGGHGGAGGQGGTANMTHTGSIDTSGDNSAGVLLQSIGGGGGVGGDANATGVIASIAIGGNGGAAGDGGQVQFSSQGKIVTRAGNASAVVLQSIGGGGGSAGSANAVGVGVGLNVTMANGGRGGSGGSGGAVSFLHESQGSITTLGAHGNGVLAQSIGGGGGQGGMAHSRGITIAPPTGDNPSGALSLAIANGGAGQGAGSGGTVMLANQGGIVNTQGGQSGGMVAQSIGGGGGQGGGVLAPVKMPVVGNASINLQLSVRHGGQGGRGGNGGRVTVSNTGEGVISTSGTGSAGIVAQSVGAGGGNGGIVQQHDAGSFNDILGSPMQLPGLLDTAIGWLEKGPELKLGKAVDLSVQMTTGGSGGAGGAASPFDVRNDGRVETAGDHAPGIIAQSIGGGGGNAGLIDATGASSLLSSIDALIKASESAGQNAFSLTLPKTNIVHQTGGSGGAAGAGGGTAADPSVVRNAGTITTHGDGSPGIVAQSVGGGGGNSAASGQSLVDAVARAAGGQSAEIIEKITGIIEIIGSKGGTALGSVIDVRHGGTDGAGGAGGVVKVDAGASSGRIATGGRHAPGILAQSVGGGGGISSIDQPMFFWSDTKASLALGAKAAHAAGYVSSAGGAVGIDLGGAVATGGSGSAGVMAQSVGGGGGTALVSSDASLAGVDVALGAGGNGGFAIPNVDGDGGGVTVTSASGIITTEGALSFGILAQSVGGGGGYVAIDNAAAPAAAPVDIAFGSTGGMSAGGGAVTVAQNAGTILTSGSHAHGMVGQSVGSGGGMAMLGAQSAQVVLKPAGGAVGGGHGGTVSLSVSGIVSTSGDGAVGMLAQSVGGGGGMTGDQSSARYATDIIQNAGLTGGAGDGGSVNVGVNAGGSVQTAGSNAAAILAMSIGGGGVFKDGTLYQYNAPPNQQARGGPISVTIGQGARVVAKGENAPALVVLSSGATGSGAISIGLAPGSLLAASATSGTAILAVSNSAPSTITNAGLIQARTAIDVSGAATVNNSGTVAGDVLMGSGSVFHNQPGASLYSGARFEGVLNNAGVFNPGGPDVFQKTVVTGAWNNTGTYRPDLDFSTHDSDFVSVSGPSTFSGTVTPVLHNPVKGVWLGIAHFGIPQTTAPVVSSDTPLFTYALKNNGGEGWSDPLISVDADFMSSTLSLNADRAGIARSLQGLWERGDKNSAALFDKFTGIQTEGQYRDALNGIAHDGQFARAANQAHASYASMNRMMSCPAFMGEGTLLREGDCAWARMEAGWVRRDTTSDDEGYRIRQQTFTAGAQRRLSGNWLFGGSVSYAHGRTTSSSRLSGDSDTFSGGLALKYNRAPWQLVVAVHGGVETSRMSRGTLDGVAQSKPRTSFLAGRLRMAYEFSRPSWYLRPYADFDVHHIRLHGYQERGPGMYNLRVRGNTTDSFMFSPMLEAGGRKDLDDGSTLRAYVAGGMSFLGGADVVTTMQLSSLGAPTFSLRAGMPRTYANLLAGLEYVTPKGMELKAEYSLRANSRYRDQSVALRGAYRF
ncbi:MAG: autotransporter outer membrane beta-barrel domain-containing protein [Candidimonas sp.]